MGQEFSNFVRNYLRNFPSTYRRAFCVTSLVGFEEVAEMMGWVAVDAHESNTNFLSAHTTHTSNITAIIKLKLE